MAASSAARTASRCGRASARGRREGVDHRAAAEGALRRLIADNEAIAVQGADRAFEIELNEGIRSRGQGIALEQHDARTDLARAQVEANGRPVRQRTALARQQSQTDVDALARRMHRVVEQPVAALDVGLCQSAAEIERQALADLARRRLATLGMHAAHARRQAARRDDEPVARRDAA